MPRPGIFYPPLPPPHENTNILQKAQLSTNEKKNKQNQKKINLSIVLYTQIE